MFIGLLRLRLHERNGFGHRWEIGASRWLWSQFGVLCPLICTKGLIWLSVPAVAEVLLVVSGCFLVPALSIHCELMSQVSLSLNLNSIFSILSFEPPLSVYEEH